jgi:S-formylglutathione hydrolase FrmB
MRTISHRFIVSFALIVLAISAPAGVAPSRTARTLRIESAAIGTEATFAVLLPPDYESSATTRYPVVYLLHGGTQNHTAFPARAWFNADVSKRRMIVVMPYLQPFTFSSRADRPAPVEEFLGRELPAYIDANYRTVNDRRARAIAGISMGGYGATLLGLKRPDVFGTIGAISAALSTGGRPDNVASLVAGLTPETAAYFFVACGVADSVLPSSRELVTQLRDRQIRSEFHEVPGGHDWSVWDSQVRAFFDVLAKLPGWGSGQ